MFVCIVIEVALVSGADSRGGRPSPVRVVAEEKVSYLHPLRPVFGRPVPLFQEQMMIRRMLQALALRRRMSSGAMGFFAVSKNAEAFVNLFMKGLQQRGIPQISEEILYQVRRFADFVFPNAFLFFFSHRVRIGLALFTTPSISRGFCLINRGFFRLPY